MNSHQRVLSIMNNEMDHKAMMFNIAVNFPDVVYDAYVSLYGQSPDQVIIRMANSGSTKIQCVKQYRELVDCGLKEAIDHVASLYPFPCAYR